PADMARGAGWRLARSCPRYAPGSPARIAMALAPVVRAARLAPPPATAMRPPANRSLPGRAAIVRKDAAAIAHPVPVARARRGMAAGVHPGAAATVPAIAERWG